jgi:hypothetical protein
LAGFGQSQKSGPETDGGDLVIDIRKDHPSYVVDLYPQNPNLDVNPNPNPNPNPSLAGGWRFDGKIEVRKQVDVVTHC